MSMNLPRPFLKRPNPFLPALQFLSNSFNSSPPSQKTYNASSWNDGPSTPRSSIDMGTPSTSRTAVTHASHTRQSSAGSFLDTPSTTGGIPLIDFSPIPSPTPYGSRNRSATQSEDEDESVPLSLRPLVAESNVGLGGRWRRAWTDGGLGAFLFSTWAGWQVYVSILVGWSIVMGMLLVLVNRVVLWSGVYKFPYPLMATFLQFWFTHIFLVMASSLSRALAHLLRRLGLSALVAPSHLINSKSPAQRNRGGFSINPLRLASRILSPTGGIAGGGLLEFDRKTAWKVLPLAIIFVGKVLLSNISFSYAAIPLYSLCRIGTIPLTLILTATLTRTTHSISTLSSTLITTLNLLMASIRTSYRVSWESIVAGIFSMLFTSLYPIFLERTHRLLTAAQVPQGDVLTSFSPAHPGTSANDVSGSKQETRAYYRVLHYTSLLSLMMLLPMVLVSGELPNMLRNCYFLDVPWFWFLVISGGFASWAVFSVSLALVRATSPLTTNFVSLPRTAAQMVLLSGARLPVHAWVGVALCWMGSLWYATIRREEGRRGEKRRLEGR